MFRIHFLYGFLQFFPGLDLGDLATTLVWVPEAPFYPESETTAFSYELWLLGAGVFTLALLLSVAYYRYDERLEERSPVDPVRVMGVLLVASAVVLSASWWYVRRELSLTVPVGVLFMYLLGGLLVFVERTEGPPDEEPDPESRERRPDEGGNRESTERRPDEGPTHE